MIFVIAIEGISIVQSWTYTACAIAIAVLSLIVVRIVIGSPSRKLGAPTNVQLQDRPPALVKTHDGDA